MDGSTIFQPMEQERKRGPTRNIPPLLFFGVFLAGLWVELAYTRLRVFDGVPERQRVASGLVLVAAGLLLALWSTITFWRSRTTVLPFRSATNLVTHGPYRFTRNPIYVGDAITYLGAAIALDAGWSLVLAPVAVMIVHLFVIRKEERHLRERFGEAYDAYRSRVRRWI